MRDHILHISGDFAKQSIYHDLAKSLSVHNFDQSFFVPVRSNEELIYEGPGLDTGKYLSLKIISPHHKIFFHTKIKKITARLIKEFNLDMFSLCHAHFLYSDGGVALRLKELYDLDYVVSVRNTDINFFMVYRPDLKKTMLRIAKNAKRIIFLTPTYKDKFLSQIPLSYRKIIRDKAVIIPSALNQDWHTAKPIKPSQVDMFKVLYVGDFSKNKNIINLIEACRIIKSKRKIHLTLIGGGGNYEKKIIRYIKKNAIDFVSYDGKISDINQLMNIYKKHDVLAMPSFYETFGLTYLEALSQGLPVVHSKGQGIDGLFNDNEIVQSVNPKDVSSIAAGISKFLSFNESRQSKCMEAVKEYTWTNISKLLAEEYNKVLSK